MIKTQKLYADSTRIYKELLNLKWISGVDLIKRFGYKATTRLSDLRKAGIILESRTPEWDKTYRFLEYKISSVPDNVYVMDGSIRRIDDLSTTNLRPIEVIRIAVTQNIVYREIITLPERRRSIDNLKEYIRIGKHPFFKGILRNEV